MAGAAAAGLGAYDDLAEQAEQQVRKGLAGHLGALARGEVTTGAVKVLGLAASGLAASALVQARPDQPPRPGRRWSPTCSSVARWWPAARTWSTCWTCAPAGH